MAVRTNARRSLAEETRNKLIDAAEAIVIEDGYAAVTARRLAEQIGLKRTIVHYYFRKIDDLLVEVIKRGGGEVIEAARKSLESGDPLQAIWEFRADTSVRSLEMMALASHNETIRAEAARLSQEYRDIRAQAIERYLDARGIEPATPPMVTAIAISSIARTLAGDKLMGLSVGHAETEKLVKEWIERFVERGEWVAHREPKAGIKAEAAVWDIAGATAAVPETERKGDGIAQPSDM